MALRWQLELELAETIDTYSGTTLPVSHKQDKVYRLNDRVCVLNEGYQVILVSQTGQYQDKRQPAR